MAFLNHSHAMILPPKLTKRSLSSSWNQTFPLRQSHSTEAISACFKQPKFSGNMNWRGSNWGPRSSSIFWHGNYRKTAISVKLQDEATATPETKDGDHHHPPSESGSNESSKASVLKWLQDHKTKVDENICQLTMKLNDDAIRTGLSKFLSETVLVLAHPNITILYSCYKNIVLPIYAKMTETKLSKKPTKRLDDVEGVDAAKAELREALLILQKDSAYMKHGVKLSRGILLVGAPGTGKTLLAKAVAGEAAGDVSFFSVFASDYAEVGTGAAGLRDLFSEAREHAPSIVFIDEIEAISSRPREKTLNHLHPALSQLLNEMNKTNKDGSMILVIAASNRPETLGQELMGSSQFFKKVLVDKPDRDGRRKIFALHMRDSSMLDKEAICNNVASLTEGFVGGDLKTIAGDSRLLAARREHIHVTLGDVLDAAEGFRSERYSFGPRAQEFMEMEDGSMGFGSQN